MGYLRCGGLFLPGLKAAGLPSPISVRWLIARVLGPALRWRGCSRKVDNYGTVSSFRDSGALRYRRSWMIGAVFGEIAPTTLPILYHIEGKTGPIRSVIGEARATFSQNCAAVIYIVATQVLP